MKSTIMSTMNEKLERLSQDIKSCDTFNMTSIGAYIIEKGSDYENLKEFDNYEAAKSLHIGDTCIDYLSKDSLKREVIGLLHYKVIEKYVDLYGNIFLVCNVI